MIRVVDILNKKSTEKSSVCFDLILHNPQYPIRGTCLCKEKLQEGNPSSRLLDSMCSCVVNDE